MSTAAIVAGNTVVMKPASNSPTSRLLLRADVRGGGPAPRRLNFLTGKGAVIGDVLVQHPKTRFIAFTGSKDVGVGFNELAARCSPDRSGSSAYGAEMGGKDAIIVDSEADLDAAADGVVASAFGFQGQKCSACSRAIVDASGLRRVRRTVLKRAASDQVGDPIDPAMPSGR